MKMKLIDKSKVVAEIKSLMRTTFTNFYEGVNCAAQTLLEIIDTLEVKEVEEIPVSNDLEEAARKVGQKYFPDENNIWARPNYEAIAAANVFKEGAKWQEEQIMKDAIEREVKEDAGGYPFIEATELYDYDNDKPLAKAGDKVKVMFIKD